MLRARTVLPREMPRISETSFPGMLAVVVVIIVVYLDVLS
jgi:hypothetical protein